MDVTDQLSESSTSSISLSSKKEEILELKAEQKIVQTEGDKRVKIVRGAS
jgi:hypothetical protein